MSNRTLIEINHDFCPTNEDVAKWGGQMQAYMRSGRPGALPEGVTHLGMRHHSEPSLVEKLTAERDEARAMLAKARDLMQKVVAALPEPRGGAEMRENESKT